MHNQNINKKSKDIVFIGGGLTGPMLLIYLAQEIQHNNLSLIGNTLHLIDPKGFIGGGIAYGDCHAAHVLNSTRDEMSPWNQNEFHRWCIDQGHNDNIQTFNARSDYRRFLSEKVQASIQVLKKHGANIIEHNCNAKIIQTHDGFDIQNEKGELLVSSIAANDINLTIGYGPNKNFENLWRFDGQGYIHNIYNHNAIKNIATPHNQDNKVRIAFVGTGPALYDFINEYDGNTEQTELIIFSREGQLLNIRDVSIEPNEVSIVPDYLADSRYIPATFKELKGKILHDFDQPSQNNNRSPRRTALDIIKNIRPLLERSSLEFATIFRKSTLHGWLKHTATPPPIESHEKLRAFKPTVIAQKLNGNITRLENGKFSISSNTEGKEGITVDYIINGTGHGRHNSEIFCDLKEQGLAIVNRKLDILSTDSTGYKLIGSGINCIGPATHFGCDGVESFADNAHRLAQEIIANSANNHSPIPRTIPQSEEPQTQVIR